MLVDDDPTRRPDLEAGPGLDPDGPRHHDSWLRPGPSVGPKAASVVSGRIASAVSSLPPAAAVKGTRAPPVWSVPTMAGPSKVAPVAAEQHRDRRHANAVRVGERDDQFAPCARGDGGGVESELERPTEVLVGEGLGLDLAGPADHVGLRAPNSVSSEASSVSTTSGTPW